MQKHLVIFAKEPRLGRVKTRLGREIGHVLAWRFYRSMLHSVPRNLINKGPWKTWLAVSPDNGVFQDIRMRQISYLPQGGGDLGKRMLSPAQTLPKGAFVVIGTDVPAIQPKHIRYAFKLLGQKDVVFGPAEDGGFWLVGHKRHPNMINPYKKLVRWSHPETLNDCLANLKGQKVGFVDTLYDVDDAQSLRRWRKDR